jgi:hypothetical protein
MPAHFNELLIALHTVGTAWCKSERASERAWGAHLLEDWRSLSLMADQPPHAAVEGLTDRLLDGTPAR